KSIRGGRDFRLLTRHPRIEIFPHCRENKVLPGDVSIQLRNHPLGLSRSHSPASRSFPCICDFLRLLPVCLFRASLNAPAVRQRKAGEPKLRAFSLSYAGHADNSTDNIRACPELFSLVRLLGKRALCLGALASQGFESPCLQPSLLERSAKSEGCHA